MYNLGSIPGIQYGPESHQEPSLRTEQKQSKKERNGGEKRELFQMQPWCEEHSCNLTIKINLLGAGVIAQE